MGEEYALYPTLTRLEHHNRQPIASSHAELPATFEDFDARWWSWLTSEVIDGRKIVATRHGEMRLAAAKDWRRPQAYMVLAAYADTDELVTVAGSFYAIQVAAEVTDRSTLRVQIDCYYPDLVESVYERMLAFITEQWPAAEDVEDLRASGDMVPTPRVQRTQFGRAEWLRKAEVLYVAKSQSSS